jgi:hypothetical protein
VRKHPNTLLGEVTARVGGCVRGPNTQSRNADLGMGGGRSEGAKLQRNRLCGKKIISAFRIPLFPNPQSKFPNPKSPSFPPSLLPKQLTPLPASLQPVAYSLNQPRSLSRPIQNPKSKISLPPRLGRARFARQPRPFCQRCATLSTKTWWNLPAAWPIPCLPMGINLGSHHGANTLPNLL